jgi:CubicO group peptidase (beta-lactamase class C family)
MPGTTRILFRRHGTPVFAMKNFALILLTISCLVRADEIDAYLQAQMAWQHIPGLSVMITRDRHLVKAKGYGLANVETGTPATAETKFKLASLSKQFVAAGIMILVQDGRLHLSDSITNYLEDVPEAWKVITIRHLLTHTSGIVKDSAAFDPYKAQPDIDIIRSVYSVPLQFQPGDAWSYSNIGYYVLAEVIYRVTHRPWTEFIQRQVFDAAGMSGDLTADPAIIIPHRASGYETRMGILQNSEVWRAVRPSGGFVGSVIDLAIWDAALDDDRILGPTNRVLLWTPVKLNDQTTEGYGLGWFVAELNGHLRIHHDGGVPGFSADFEKFPNDRISVAILANIGQRDIRDLTIGVAAMILPALKPVSDPVIEDHAPELTQRIRGIVGELAMGQTDAKQFTPELAGWLAGDLKRGFGDDLHRLGILESLGLLSRDVKDGEVTCRYRMEFRYVTLTVECTLDKDDRIKRLSIGS